MGEYLDSVIAIYQLFFPSLLDMCGFLLVRMGPIVLPIFGAQVLLVIVKRAWRAVTAENAPESGIYEDGTTEDAWEQAEFDLDWLRGDIVGGKLNLDFDNVESDYMDLLRLVDKGDIDFNQFRRAQGKFFAEYQDQIKDAREDDGGQISLW